LIFSISLYEVSYGQGSLIAVFMIDTSMLKKFGLTKMREYYQSTLTNALSHERMTPLNAIINCCETV